MSKSLSRRRNPFTFLTPFVSVAVDKPKDGIQIHGILYTSLENAMNALCITVGGDQSPTLNLGMNSLPLKEYVLHMITPPEHEAVYCIITSINISDPDRLSFDSLENAMAEFKTLAVTKSSTLYEESRLRRSPGVQHSGVLSIHLPFRSVYGKIPKSLSDKILNHDNTDTLLSSDAIMSIFQYQNDMAHRLRFIPAYLRYSYHSFFQVNSSSELSIIGIYGCNIPLPPKALHRALPSLEPHAEPRRNPRTPRRKYEVLSQDTKEYIVLLHFLHNWSAEFIASDFIIETDAVQRVIDEHIQKTEMKEEARALDELIFKAYAQGLSEEDIASKYNLSVDYIFSLLHGEKH